MSQSGLPTHLAVFAKYWEPGHVKTRLGARIGDQVASTIQREFLGHLLHRFRSTADCRTLVFWPPEKEREFQEFIPRQWGMACQKAGELDTKLSHFLKSRFPQHPERMVVVGADSPDLPQEFLGEAFGLLNRHNVVLGPSLDGGYYLVGLNAYVPIFDDIAWSTAAVFDQTVEHLRRQEIDFAVLKAWEDVDDWPSLQSLLHRLQKNEADPDQSHLLDRLQAILGMASP